MRQNENSNAMLKNSHNGLCSPCFLCCFFFKKKKTLENNHRTGGLEGVKTSSSIIVYFNQNQEARWKCSYESSADGKLLNQTRSAYRYLSSYSWTKLSEDMKKHHILNLQWNKIHRMVFQCFVHLSTKSRSKAGVVAMPKWITGQVKRTEGAVLSG